MEPQKIAYFSMEIGLTDQIPTYSGGLGVLAGDTIRSSADLTLPLIAVTLVSKKGYFRQELTADGKQLEYPDEWSPERFMTLLPPQVTVKIQGRDVRLQAWHYDYQSPTGGKVPIFYLDTDVEGNSDEDRDITAYLYGGDYRYRLKQETVLGIGGVRMIEALGFDVRRYHMNEGHSGLLGVELLRRYGMDENKVREQCIFTTHTPVEAGHDQFPYDVVRDIIGEVIPINDLQRLGGQDRLNMTLLALNLSSYHNGVAKKHQEISRRMFPGYEINAITNGIHSYTWTCPSFRRLYDRYFPGWANEPELLVRMDLVPDDQVWDAHMEAKKELIDLVNSQTQTQMNYNALTFGFARRATAYKRATLLFRDLEKLTKIGRRNPIQFIFAGKSHPKDYSGKTIIEDISRHARELQDIIKIGYFADYGIDIAAKMVAGVDVWLNTPMRPYEASGTSGMKASHNGVLNFSVLDGWWIEGWIENVTGWAIGPHPEENISTEEIETQEIADLYNKLDYIIIPTFYQRRDEWITMMESAISKIAYYFNSHRMMRRYVTEAYF
jgi:starch phosphorylase